MTTNPFSLCDEFGPIKTVHIHDPSTGLKAIVVIDNVACGPAIGGTRMAPDTTLAECARLARAMTLKNAAAGLPHGGAKSVIQADPSMPIADKEQLIRAFAIALRDLTEYIPGPDMGTNETCMAWVQDEIGRSVGLPRVIGGIPLDDIGATGIGVAMATEVALELNGMPVKGSRIAVQGFGAVGRHAALQLCRRGARLVAASDSTGTVVNPDGIDVNALIATKNQHGELIAHPGVQVSGRDDIVGVDCDVWVPAARPDVITEANMDQLKARFIVQGANIPVTEAAERKLHERGVLSVPDFIANAGGVICAAVEYHGGSQAAALAAIEEKVTANTREVLEQARAKQQDPRSAAMAMATKRVRQAMKLRRW